MTIADRRTIDLICQNMLPAQREALAAYFISSDNRDATAGLVEAAIRAAILRGIPAEQFAGMVKTIWDHYAAHMNEDNEARMG